MATYTSRNRNRNCFIVTTALISFFFILSVHRSKYHESIDFTTMESLIFDNLAKNFSQNWRGLTKEQIGNMSVLGRILFLNEEPPKIHKSDKIYHIAIWKYGNTIANRHLKQFSSQYKNPFDNCRVKNCKIVHENTSIKNADIVIFHLHRMKGIVDLPKHNQRQPQQIWAFLTDESSHNTFLNSKVNNLTIYNNLFNWSMMYRIDADIPVPYGRIVLRKRPLNTVQIGHKRRDVLVAILGSNCGGRNGRWRYVKELQKHIQVDVYGKCGPLKCPGHFKKDCPALDSYLFYLSFENSNCLEYVTEKLWWNALHKNAIPIVMGANRDTYRKILPPKSYLNVDDYANPQALANHILYLNKTGDYHQYYYWKQHFEVENEHGYFQSKSVHYCRICEAMNYNENKQKIYRNLEEFWGSAKNCFPPWSH